MKYFLLSSVLHIIRDYLEPTVTRAQDKMSSHTLQHGQTTLANSRFVGSAARQVMENQQYRTPSLNAMISKVDSSEISSFSEAQAIEISSIIWSLPSPISYIIFYRRQDVQLTMRLKPIHSSPLNLRHINSRNSLSNQFGRWPL